MAWECVYCGADANEECAASCAEERLRERAEELEAENERLRDALEEIAADKGHNPRGPCRCSGCTAERALGKRE